MKSNSQIVIDIITDRELWETLNENILHNPDDQYLDTNIVEAVEKLSYLRELLENAPKELDRISFERRKDMVSALTALLRNRHSSSQCIIQIDKLYDLVMESGIQITTIGKKDITKEIENLRKKGKELDLLISSIKEVANASTNISVLQERAIAIVKNIEDYSDKSRYSTDIIEEKFDESKSLHAQIDIFYRSIQENEKNIEIKRLSIETFSENIDELKDRVEHYEQRMGRLLEEEQVINNLILDAETALNLNSALGISAAFASQYDKSNNSTLKWWIVGAGTFYFIALLMTVWIVGGWGISNPDSWSSIVGRIVAVGITITAATFCAGQFRRQKMLAEDYAYKAVLSKSIVAFTEEIKKRDDSKVADYLQKVLMEIHKDPQRSRTKRSSSIKLDSQAIIEKIIDKVPTGK